MTVVLLKDGLEGALLIGEPTGQPPNFFSGGSNSALPVSGARFRISTLKEYMRLGSDEIAVWPDIYVPQTLEAFMNNRDLVLETIISS
jgi:hypothetical protein